MGTLYIIGTPIGNLDDITLHALNVLRSSSIVAVEKWEDSIKLLRHFDIRPAQLLKFSESVQRRMIPQIITMLATSDVAVITSAGMPGVSDPGAALVAECLKQQIPVVPIPGPSALTTAIGVSGFTGSFLFIEFFPKKISARRKAVTDAINISSNLVFFESPYRILKALEVIVTIAPDVPLFIGREMTKKFEQYLLTTPCEAVAQIQNKTLLTKGEFTVILGCGEKRTHLNNIPEPRCD